MAEEIKGGGSELTGGYRTGEPSSGSGISIESRPDPTQTMPVFDQGRAVDSMSVEEAKAEWNKMTRDEKDEYRAWPRSVFLSRRDALWKHGFSEQLANKEKSRQEESQKTVEEAKVKLQDYTDELFQKRTEKVIRERWGNNTNQEIKFVQDFVLKNASQEFKNYLDSTRLGDNPNVVFFAHGLANLVKEYPDASFVVPALERAVREYAQGVERKKEKSELTRRGGGK